MFFLSAILWEAILSFVSATQLIKITIPDYLHGRKLNPTRRTVSSGNHDDGPASQTVVRQRAAVGMTTDD